MIRKRIHILICILLCFSLVFTGVLPIFADSQYRTSMQEGAAISPEPFKSVQPIDIDGYYAEDEDRTQPAVAYDASLDIYLLVYKNAGRDYEDNGIMGQFISNNGEAISERFELQVRYPEDNYMLKRSPDVAWGDGVFLAVWIDDNFHNCRVMGRFISPAGDYLSDYFVLDDENPSIRDHNLSVAYGDDGRFLVVWSDSSNVYGRMVSFSNASKPEAEGISEEIQISDGDYYYGSVSAAYSEESGKFLVVWDDNRETGYYENNIYGRMISLQGETDTDGFPVCTSEGDQADPSVTYNVSANSFFVIWADGRSVTDGVSVYGKHLDSNGDPISGSEEQMVAEELDGEYAHPTIEYSSFRDEYLPVWAETHYYGEEGSEAYGGGQQLREDLTAAAEKLTFGYQIYNRTYCKLDLASSTRAGKYLVVYPCMYMDYSGDNLIEYLRWELIGDATPESHGILQFEKISNEVGEGEGAALIKVKRTGGSDGRVTVDYKTINRGYAYSAAPGLDYEETGSTLVFEDGDTEKTFQVVIREDQLIEDNEHIGLVLSSPTGGAELGSITEADLNIIDNDEPEFPYFSFYKPPYTVSESVYKNVGIDYAQIGVFFSGFGDVPAYSPPLEYTTVSAYVYYSTSDGSATEGQDYRSAAGMLEFTAEDYSEAADGFIKYFAVPVIDDDKDETAETVNLTLSSPTDGTIVRLPNPTVLTILDDDDTPTQSSGGKKHHNSSSPVPVPSVEAAPPTEGLPNDALVDRMPGYVAISTPVKVNEVKDEIILSYNNTILANNPGHDPRIYYWRPEVSKWVALATYPNGAGSVKAINDGGYKGWFVVFGVVQPHFSDVSGSWAEQLINRMNGLGLIEGYAVKGSALRAAKPAQKVTRAEFTMFVTRIMNMNPDNILLPDMPANEVESVLNQAYEDAPEISPWARAAIAKATKAGLIPFEDSGFKPLEPITRIEAAVIVSRALKHFKDFKAVDLSSFKDYGDIPGWAAGEIVENAIEGYKDNTLKPNADIARAESLAMLMRLFIKGLGW